MMQRSQMSQSMSQSIRVSALLMALVATLLPACSDRETAGTGATATRSGDKGEGATASATRTLVINTDASDPAPRAAIEAAAKGFEAAHPGVKVTINTFDHEGYKTSIRNFLTADPPDVALWYAGNRMAPFVKAGLFEDVTDLWTGEGLDDKLASAAASMTIDGKKWGVPYTYYQWGIYYRKDIFDKVGLQEPKTWAELLEVCARLEAAKITPFAIGTRAPWPAGGWFDYLNLRVNGYEFHMELTSGKVPYTDPRVQAVFDRWDELVKPGYYLDNHPSYQWQEALPAFVKGEAAMFLMGNFAVAPMREAGLKDEQIGFMQFPEITPGIPRAEDAPTDTMHIPSKAKNKADARKFLAHVARADVQARMNEILGQLPVNREAQRPEDKFLSLGFTMLSSAHALAQFYDRDAPPDMAKAGMDGFQRYMLKPGERAQILEQLEQARQRVYK
jgi:multiple sugar transport system substrate-binding protein